MKLEELKIVKDAFKIAINLLDHYATLDEYKTIKKANDIVVKKFNEQTKLINKPKQKSKYCKCNTPDLYLDLELEKELCYTCKKPLAI